MRVNQGRWPAGKGSRGYLTQHRGFTVQIVSNPDTNGFMHLQAGYSIECKELYRSGLAAHPQRPAYYVTGKANAELLPDFSVVVGEDVPWIRIDPDDPIYSDMKSGFFPDFTY